MSEGEFANWTLVLAAGLCVVATWGLNKAHSILADAKRLRQEAHEYCDEANRILDESNRNYEEVMASKREIMEALAESKLH